MSEIKGKISIVLQEAGSKSEGSVAILHTADGKAYTLYRDNSLPQDDPFFAPLNNQAVTVNGEIEEKTKYICINSILLSDGTLLLPPAATKSTSNIFIDRKEPSAIESTPETNNENNNPINYNK